MRISIIASLLTSIVTLAACSPSVPPPAAQTTQTVSSVPATTSTDVAPAVAPGTTSSDVTPAAAPTTGLWFTPAALSACGTGRDVVKINWDVTSISKATSVHIVIPAQKGPEGLFAAVGPKGSRDSGAWMHAGAMIVVRDAADDTELARGTEGSIPCK